jgi:asparagine synthase (glutamine-hydrolysing)
MCGIAGKLSFDGSPVCREIVDAMRDLQVHRGPDGAGSWTDGPVGLAHRRLSIIDLSDSALQPMANEDGSVVIVFNGEIYNFQALREELSGKGHVFSSSSDTEVIVHLYEEMGPRVVERLRGMFAFAIWDARKRRLMLARDRVGKKPLFYHMDGRGIAFASEVRSLFADQSIPREPDYLAIHHYLTYQYVPAPWSAFAGVASLPPASVMIVSEDGAHTIERYWRLDYSEKLDIAEDEAIERVTELIMEATRLRMIADVPLGAFLSGGVDSSVVVAAMALQSSEPVKTFTIGFREQAYDEAPYARAVAERYSTDHTELVVEPHAIDVLPKLVWHYGNPFADSSALPTYYVAEMTRRYVTVALNGDGGDESFGGYERYARFLAMRRFDALSPTIRDALWRFVPESRRLPRTGLSRKARRAAELFLGGPERRYAEFMLYFTNREKAVLYTPEFAGRIRGTDSIDLLRTAWGNVGSAADADRLMGTDVAMYLPDDLLVKVDIATMANSLEARSPLLDHELMEFAAQLPADFKVRGNETKYLLKRVAERLLPHEVIYRPKMGFGVPIVDWFRGELADYVGDVLLDPLAVRRGIFRRECVETYLRDHRNGTADYSYRRWALLMLELWFQTYIDRSPVDGPIA